MRIGELARATGVDIETIRYYEKVRLLGLPARTDNGYRSYSRIHLERLAFIRHCRALDIPLADVRSLLAFLDNPQEDCAGINDLIDAQLDKVRARLASIQALERQLMSLRRQCSEPHSAAECGILHDLVAAAHGEACACHRGSRDSG